LIRDEGINRSLDEGINRNIGYNSDEILIKFKCSLCGVHRKVSVIDGLNVITLSHGWNTLLADEDLFTDKRLVAYIMERIGLTIMVCP
jgi:phage-related holin